LWSPPKSSAFGAHCGTFVILRMAASPLPYVGDKDESSMCPQHREDEGSWVSPPPRKSQTVHRGKEQCWCAEGRGERSPLWLCASMSIPAGPLGEQELPTEGGRHCTAKFARPVLARVVGFSSPGQLALPTPAPELLRVEGWMCALVPKRTWDTWTSHEEQAARGLCPGLVL
jgi:hypothetical protein